MTCAFLGQRPIWEICLHYGDNVQKIGDIRQVVPRRSNQPRADVFCLHSWRSAWAVQANTAYCPGDLFILWDGIIHQKMERGVFHRDCLSRRWFVPVELLPFRHYFGKGYSGWGWGAVDCLIILSPHLYPYLAKSSGSWPDDNHS